MKASQIRTLMRALKDAPAVTATVITVDHLAELQNGDVVLRIEHETGDISAPSRVRATVMRAEPKNTS